MKAKKVDSRKSTHSIFTYVNLRTGRPTGNMILVDDNSVHGGKFAKGWTRQVSQFCRRMIDEEIKFLRPKTWTELLVHCVEEVEAGVGFQLFLVGHYDYDKNAIVQMKTNPVPFASFVVPTVEDELKVFLDFKTFKERFGYELQD